jgi:hypothetical protein
MQYVGIIKNRRDPFDGADSSCNYKLEENDSMYAMWKSLRDRDWAWAQEL